MSTDNADDEPGIALRGEVHPEEDGPGGEGGGGGGEKPEPGGGPGGGEHGQQQRGEKHQQARHRAAPQLLPTEWLASYLTQKSGYSMAAAARTPL